MELFIKIWPILTWILMAVIVVPHDIIKDKEIAARFLMSQIILLIVQVICSIIYFINI